MINELIIEALAQAIPSLANDNSIILATDIETYRKSPTGRLKLRKFYTEEEAEQLGLYIPLYGVASQDFEVDDPFPPEWWEKWKPEHPLLRGMIARSFEKSQRRQAAKDDDGHHHFAP